MDTISIENAADITYSPDDILLMRMHKKSNIDLEKAHKIAEAASNLSGDKIHANLVDIREMTFMSGDARKFFGQQNKNTVKAVAVVSNSAIHKPLVNLYLKFSRPTLPTKFFDKEEDARAWLLAQMGR